MRGSLLDSRANSPRTAMGFRHLSGLLEYVGFSGMEHGEIRFTRGNVWQW
jgi:hypothetical protein